MSHTPGGRAPTPTARPPNRCPPIRSGQADRCMTMCANAIAPAIPRPCGAPSKRPSPNVTGRFSRWDGRCAAGSTDSSAPCGLVAGRWTVTVCTSVRRWTGGGWSRSTSPGCCGCVPTSRYRGGCGWSCPQARTATADPATVSAHCFSHTGLRDNCFGPPRHHHATRSSGASHVKSPPPRVRAATPKAIPSPC